METKPKRKYNLSKKGREVLQKNGRSNILAWRERIGEEWHEHQLRAAKLGGRPRKIV